MKVQQPFNTVSSRVTLSLKYCRHCGLLLSKWMKNHPFWIHRFFSWRKILMMWIFYLILDFSKETDPTILYKRHHDLSYLLSLNYIYHAKSLCIWETLSSQKEHLKSHTCKKSSVNPDSIIIFITWQILNFKFVGKKIFSNLTSNTQMSIENAGMNDLTKNLLRTG